MDPLSFLPSLDDFFWCACGERLSLQASRTSFSLHRSVSFLMDVLRPDDVECPVLTVLTVLCRTLTIHPIPPSTRRPPLCSRGLADLVHCECFRIVFCSTRSRRHHQTYGENCATEVPAWPCLLPSGQGRSGWDLGKVTFEEQRRNDARSGWDLASTGHTKQAFWFSGFSGRVSCLMLADVACKP